MSWTEKYNMLRTYVFWLKLLGGGVLAVVLTVWGYRRERQKEAARQKLFNRPFDQ